MSPIAYSFNHEQLLDAITSIEGCEKIIFSLCNLEIPGSGKFAMHTVAHFFDADGTLLNENDNEIGCPYPPGWKNGDGYRVVHDELEVCPKFVISKVNLKASLDNNYFVKDNVRQLIVHAEGEAVSGPSEDMLETYINILSQNEDGSDVTLTKKAVTYPVVQAIPA